MNELVVGFIPLLDCAALAVAREKGFAEDEGVALTLVRESSWANIRDRLVVGHFDAAHMLGPMTVASTLGIGHLRVPLAAPFALGLGGNAITVSKAVYDEMQVHGSDAPRPATTTPVAGAPGSATPVARLVGEALARVVAARARAGSPPLTFGMVYPFSCHNYELRYWLAAVGIDPDHDVRLVVIPPPLLVDAMKAGHIDGFCVGEPWNSVAVEAGVGSIVLATTAIWRLSPEKVLGCRADWAERHPQLLSPLLRSLYRASQWCAKAEHRTELAGLLARSNYVGAPAALIDRALEGRLPMSGDGADFAAEDFHVALAHAATFPWKSHALWFYSQMVRWGQTSWSAVDFEAARGTYRPDLYRAALSPFGLELPAVDARVEGRIASSLAIPSTSAALPLDVDGFFDGRTFDPDQLEAYAHGFAIPSLS